MIYYCDDIFIDSMQRDSSTYIQLDKEWSKVHFTLIRMTWDPSIEGFLHVRIVLRLEMTHWYIWYPSNTGGL